MVECSAHLFFNKPARLFISHLSAFVAEFCRADLRVQICRKSNVQRSCYGKACRSCIKIFCKTSLYVCRRAYAVPGERIAFFQSVQGESLRFYLNVIFRRAPNGIFQSKNFDFLDFCFCISLRKYECKKHHL